MESLFIFIFVFTLLIITPLFFFIWLIQVIRKKPSAKRWMKNLGIVLLIVVFSFIFSIISLSSNTTDKNTVTSPVENTSTTQSSKNDQNFENDVDTSVTFSDIFKEFKRNELAAKELYNGNKYKINAKINGISTSGLRNLSGGATLTMEIKVDNTIVFFLAEFEKEEEDTLKRLSVGDTITFIGTCYGGNFKDCKLQ